MVSMTKDVSPPGTMSPSAQANLCPTGRLSASRPSTCNRTSVTRRVESLWTCPSIVGATPSARGCHQDEPESERDVDPERYHHEPHMPPRASPRRHVHRRPRLGSHGPGLKHVARVPPTH